MRSACAIIIRNKKVCLVPSLVGYTLPACDLDHQEDPHVAITEHVRDSLGLSSVLIRQLATYTGEKTRRTIHYFIINSVDGIIVPDPKVAWFDSQRDRDGLVRVLDPRFNSIFTRLREKGLVD